MKLLILQYFHIFIDCRNRPLHKQDARNGCLRGYSNETEFLCQAIVIPDDTVCKMNEL